jgi:hypothetical protein
MTDMNNTDESWDTYETGLWLANDHDLYVQVQNILAANEDDEQAAEQISKLQIPNSEVDVDKVDWLQIVRDERE